MTQDNIKFSSIDLAISTIRNGGFVVVADDEGRENEGDLICAASTITPQMVNFMTKEARGLICVSVTNAHAEQLGLTQMVEDNSDPYKTAFTVSIDAGPEFGVTTGISASDRATTIQRMAAPNATAQDFRRPGHIFPVLAKKGGVLRRVGHTEAASDLTRLADLPAMGVICEILNDDGSMARRDDLAAFAKKHNFPFITVAQLIQYRMERERYVTRRVVKEIETKFGIFTAVGYLDTLDGAEHLALVKGPLETLGADVPYVRVQHENIITDVLGKMHEEVPAEMAQAMAIIEDQGKGVVVYLRHRDDTAFGVIGALKAYKKYESSDSAYRAGKADLREYGVGAQILVDLGVKRFNILGASNKKIVALSGYGLEIMANQKLSEAEFEFPTPLKIEPSVEVQAAQNESFYAEVAEPVSAVATTGSVVPMRPQAQPVAIPPAAEHVEEPLRAEPRVMNGSTTTMKMGGQIISGQALFEG